MVETALIIEQLTFSAAHYLPNHPKCGCIHGHTYFVKDLMVATSEFVDFALIKKAVELFDHTFIIPEEHLNHWIEILSQFREELGIFSNVETTKGYPLVENIAVALKQRIMSIQGVTDCEFELFEGPECGCVSPKDL